MLRTTLPPVGWHNRWDCLSSAASPVNTQPYTPVGLKPLHKERPGSQMGWGLTPPTSVPIVIEPITTEGLMQPTQKTLLEHIALPTRRFMLLCPIGRLL